MKDFYIIRDGKSPNVVVNILLDEIQKNNDDKAETIEQLLSLLTEYAANAIADANTRNVFNFLLNYSRQTEVKKFLLSEVGQHVINHIAKMSNNHIVVWSMQFLQNAQSFETVDFNFILKLLNENIIYAEIIVEGTLTFPIKNSENLKKLPQSVLLKLFKACVDSEDKGSWSRYILQSLEGCVEDNFKNILHEAIVSKNLFAYLSEYYAVTLSPIIEYYSDINNNPVTAFNILLHNDKHCAIKIIKNIVDRNDFKDFLSELSTKSVCKLLEYTWPNDKLKNILLINDLLRRIKKNTVSMGDVVVAEQTIYEIVKFHFAAGIRMEDIAEEYQEIFLNKYFSAVKNLPAELSSFFIEENQNNPFLTYVAEAFVKRDDFNKIFSSLPVKSAWDFLIYFYNNKLNDDGLKTTLAHNVSFLLQMCAECFDLENMPKCMKTIVALFNETIVTEKKYNGSLVLSTLNNIIYKNNNFSVYLISSNFDFYISFFELYDYRKCEKYISETRLAKDQAELFVKNILATANLYGEKTNEKLVELLWPLFITLAKIFNFSTVSTDILERCLVGEICLEDKFCLKKLLEVSYDFENENKEFNQKQTISSNRITNIILSEGKRSLYFNTLLDVLFDATKKWNRKIELHLAYIKEYCISSNDPVLLIPLRDFYHNLWLSSFDIKNENKKLAEICGNSILELSNNLYELNSSCKEESSRYAIHFVTIGFSVNNFKNCAAVIAFVDKNHDEICNALSSEKVVRWYKEVAQWYANNKNLAKEIEYRVRALLVGGDEKNCQKLASLYNQTYNKNQKLWETYINAIAKFDNVVLCELLQAFVSVQTQNVKSSWLQRDDNAIAALVKQINTLLTKLVSNINSLQDITAKQKLIATLEPILQIMTKSKLHIIEEGFNLLPVECLQGQYTDDLFNYFTKLQKTDKSMFITHWELTLKLLRACYKQSAENTNNMLQLLMRQLDAIGDQSKKQNLIKELQNILREMTENKFSITEDRILYLLPMDCLQGVYITNAFKNIETYYGKNKTLESQQWNFLLKILQACHANYSNSIFTKDFTTAKKIIKFAVDILTNTTNKIADKESKKVKLSEFLCAILSSSNSKTQVELVEQILTLNYSLVNSMVEFLCHTWCASQNYQADADLILKAMFLSNKDTVLQIVEKKFAELNTETGAHENIVEKNKEKFSWLETKLNIEMQTVNGNIIKAFEQEVGVNIYNL